MKPAENDPIACDGYYAAFEQRVLLITLLLGTLILLFGFLFLSSTFALSFLAGALISYWNFVWMKQGMDRLLVDLPTGGALIAKRSQRAVIFKYLLRYALIGCFLYAIFRFRFFDLKAAVLGLFLSLAAILVESGLQLIKTLAEDWKHGTR